MCNNDQSVAFGPPNVCLQPLYRDVPHASLAQRRFHGIPDPPPRRHTTFSNAAFAPRSRMIISAVCVRPREPGRGCKLTAALRRTITASTSGGHFERCDGHSGSAWWRPRGRLGQLIGPKNKTSPGNHNLCYHGESGPLHRLALLPPQRQLRSGSRTRE